MTPDLTVANGRTIRTIERETLRGTETYYCATDFLKSIGQPHAGAVSEFFRNQRTVAAVFPFEEAYNPDRQAVSRISEQCGHFPTLTKRQGRLRKILVENGACCIITQNGGTSPGTYLHHVMYAIFLEWVSSKFDIEYHASSNELHRQELERKRGDARQIGSPEWKEARAEVATGAKHLARAVDYRQKVIENKPVTQWDYINAHKRQNNAVYGPDKMKEFELVKKDKGLRSIRDISGPSELDLLNTVQVSHIDLLSDDRIPMDRMNDELNRRADNLRKMLAYAATKEQRRLEEKARRAELKTDTYGEQPGLFGLGQV